jgi:hypothetical protein
MSWAAGLTGDGKRQADLPCRCFVQGGADCSFQVRRHFPSYCCESQMLEALHQTAVITDKTHSTHSSVVLPWILPAARNFGGGGRRMGIKKLVMYTMPD